jgi:guanylate kinase
VTATEGKGLLVIITAPSAGGKDAVIDRLVQKLDDAVVYVTATSRKPRPGELDGVRYYFYSPEKFRQEIEAGNFFEWSIVHGEFKGVRGDILGDTLRSHKIVIVKPDPHGMRIIKSRYRRC